VTVGPRRPRRALRQATDAEKSGIVVLRDVLSSTISEVDAKRNERSAKGEDPWGKTVEQVVYASTFAKHFSKRIALAFEPAFPGMKSGETPSQAFLGLKRVDANYSTTEAGLGLGISLKSVHYGEKKSGDSHFTHNIKRNDEELRVEASGHHIRQPFAVLVAILTLPFQACFDRSTSSFASWVEALWTLKGREDPAQRPDLFELVFVALYARDGSDLSFYQVGGHVPCPRHGKPESFLSLNDVVSLVKKAYERRNGGDFRFQGEEDH
jgi:hypothetical protein